MMWPTIVTRCCGCGVGTNVLGEWYMVRDTVWELAWRGRRKSWHNVPGQSVLCIGCLEKRIGRSDFTDAPVNNPDKGEISDRMRARLAATDRRYAASIGEVYVEDPFKRPPHQGGYAHITSEEWAEFDRRKADWEGRRRAFLQRM